VFPASESSGSIAFNQLHEVCHTRIQQKRWCPACDREVPLGELVKGYQFEKGQYIEVSKEDIDKVRPESTRVIDLVQFADESELDPMYVERTYYLAPDGKTATDAFAVMREGMRGKIGLGKLALYGREYLVGVKPRGRGIVMYTLHHAAELRTIDQVEELHAVPETVKPAEMKLARQVIGTFEAPLDLTQFHDEYIEGMQKMIEAKVAGRDIVVAEVEAPPRVVNLMDALKKSLDRVTTEKKRPAKVTAARTGGVRRRKAS
jgi:DNA end-binding protein Ku